MDPEIEVVGGAPEPAIARQMIKDLNPDVLTLDVEMPNMNGLEFLEKIMRLRPMPVVMVSTLTEHGADATLAALELGAVDYFAKPTKNVAALMESGGGELAAKVKAAAKARVRTRPRDPASVPGSYAASGRLVAIGASTGGVEALSEVLSSFPENCPPTVVTQHMPANFTASFAQRLDRAMKPHVVEAADGMPLRIGHVLLAPGGDAHLTVVGGANPRCKLLRQPKVNGHCPSVDILFDSVAALGMGSVGVILTGMGRDGAAGLKRLRDSGGQTLGQDAESSVVYGMPRVAMDIGAVEQQLPLSAIGAEILRLCAAQPEANRAARSP
jgi:two-component system chemotaxis response regulator CheB